MGVDGTFIAGLVFYSGLVILCFLSAYRKFKKYKTSPKRKFTLIRGEKERDNG